MTTTTTKRVLTPLDKTKTDRAPNIRTGRVQTWEASSKDGRWCYVREEMSGTPWAVYDLTRADRFATTELFPTLTAAREWTAEQPSAQHLVVIDCPSYAWDESDQAARLALGDEFYGRYQHLLDKAAHELIRGHLRAEWRRLGHRVHLVEYDTYVTTGPTPDVVEVLDAQRWEVWQRAADLITAAQLVHEAYLHEEWAAYRRAHPESR